MTSLTTVVFVRVLAPARWDRPIQPLGEASALGISEPPVSMHQRVRDGSHPRSGDFFRGPVRLFLGSLPFREVQRLTSLDDVEWDALFVTRP